MVTGLDPKKLISLHTLELRGNQLNSTQGINLPKLKNLFLVVPWVTGWWVLEKGHCPGGPGYQLLVGGLVAKSCLTLAMLWTEELARLLCP